MRLMMLVCSLAAMLYAADPKTAVFWSAAKTKDMAREAKGKMSAESGMGVSRAMDSLFMVHREKTSQAELHVDGADYIVCNEGEGVIEVGGKMVNPQTLRAGELRADVLEGATSYPMKAGDTLYVPKNVPHRFVVNKGKYIVYTVVKLAQVD
jgi:mannose-6-phosphate isomerase-like protein (cupin superfamily)